MPDLTTLHLPALDWAALRGAAQHLTGLQIGVMAAIAVIIWLSGFFSRSSGRKWRKRFEQERDFYTAYRAETDALHQQNRQRIAALEAQLNQPAAPMPVETAIVTEATVDAAPVVEQAAEHHDPVVEMHPAETAPVIEHAPTEPLAEHAAAEHAVVEEAAEAPVAHPLAAFGAPVAAAAMSEIPAEIVHEAASEPVVEMQTPSSVATAEVHHVEASVVETAHEIPPPSWAAPIALEADQAHAPVVEHAVEPVVEVAHVEPEPLVVASDHNDLTRLRGLDRDLHVKLSDLGLHRYEDIEKLSAEDEMALEERLGVPVGHIAREQWRSQAALLRAGNEAEFNERYGLVHA